MGSGWHRGADGIRAQAPPIAGEPDLLAASDPGGQLHGHDPDADGADHRDPRPGQAMNVFVLVLDEVEGVSVREVWAR
jgi:hypothetical protein